MAWDTERTQRLLLDSATAHFAAVGFAGARIDTIARDAGVNKERVYRYFGDKEGLFSEVLRVNVDGLLAGIEVSGEGAAAVGEFAGSLFDRCEERPDVARLLAWEGLERGDDPVARAERLAGCAETVAMIEAALRGIRRKDAGDLLLSIVSVVVSRHTMPQLADLILAGATTADRRRDAVVAQAAALADAPLAQAETHGEP